MSEQELPGMTRSADLLASTKSASERLLENPFVNAAAHSLVQGPLDAAAQVIDKTAGTNLLPSLRIIPDAKKSDFGSLDWFQQQVGGAVGAMPYLLALHQGSRSALSGTMLSADTKIMLGAGVKLGSAGANQVLRLELASAGITGFAYGGLLTPVRPEETATAGGLFAAKLRNGAVGAGTFMTMTGSMMGTKALAEGMQPSLLRTVMKNDIGAGVISGLPAGLMSAQSDSLLRGKGFASLKDSAEAMVGFSVIGGLMPAGQKGMVRLSERFSTPSKATDVTPIKDLSPKEAAQLVEPGSAPKVKPVEQVFNAEQLKKINEWKEAQATLQETKFRDSEPQRIRDLADEAYGTGAPEKGKKLHILLGNCGAGKSRITDALAKELGAMTPDSDNIKAKIPGYDKGMGNQAVHEDSSAAYKILLDRALQNGDNIVWQGVGKTAKSVTDLIEQAKSHQYEVVVHMVDAPPEVAAQRVYNRADQPPDASTGVRQMIPPEVPLNPKYQYVPRLNFFKMVGEAAQNTQAGKPNTIDGFRMWRSTAESHAAFLPPGITMPNLRPSWMPPARTDDQLDGSGLFKVKQQLDAGIGR